MATVTISISGGLPSYVGETVAFRVSHGYASKKKAIVQLRRGSTVVKTADVGYIEEDDFDVASFTIPSAGTYNGYVYLDGYPDRNATTSSFTVINPNASPTAPSGITVPTLKAGKAAVISWSAAIDPDGTIAAYELSRQVDGGAWAVVGTTASLSMTDTIGEDWSKVAYRVRAKDNNAAWSGYTTSAAVEVKPACGAVVVIDGIERELDELYCCVDGILRPISGAAGIAGITREIF